MKIVYVVDVNSILVSMKTGVIVCKFRVDSNSRKDSQDSFTYRRVFI